MTGLRYFVIAQDGNKYGPADVPTLKVWMSEGRLQMDTWLEEEGTGRRLVAQTVFSAAPPAAQQQGMQSPYQPGSPYPRDYAYPRQSDGQTQFVIGWVCAVASLLFCPVGLGLAAVILGVVAKGKGHPKAHILIICAVVFAGLGVLFGVFLAMSMPSFFS